VAATTAVATEAVTAAVKEVVAMVHPMIGSNCGAARRRCGRGLETRSFVRIHNLHLVSLAGEYSCKTVCFAAGEQSTGLLSAFFRSVKLGSFLSSFVASFFCVMT